MAPSVARYTILAFGLSSFTAGVGSLLRPSGSLASLGLPAAALPAANGNALAAVAMGVYYTLAAAQDNRPFFLATVPMRLASAAVFWRQGWGLVAVWEGGGAALTLLALAWDARRSRGGDGVNHKDTRPRRSLALVDSVSKDWGGSPPVARLHSTARSELGTKS